MFHLRHSDSLLTSGASGEEHLEPLVVLARKVRRARIGEFDDEAPYAPPEIYIYRKYGLNSLFILQPYSRDSFESVVTITEYSASSIMSA